MKVSKIFATVVAVAVVGATVVTPVSAGTLEQDQAWVKAQAEAGMKSGLAYLDSALATGATAAADRDAKAAAGLAAAQANLDAAKATLAVAAADRDAKAAAGLEAAKANLRAAGWNI